jgi:hypothetical protein
MKITKLNIRHKQSFNWKSVSFDEQVSVIYSEKNMTGKTTLMRAILHTIGFPIPNTELIRFDDFEFYMEIEKDGNIININRVGKLLKINENEFDLPIEQTDAHALLFGTTNQEIISNLLGAIYFDQEKGWTLLNRGTIIGTNRFGIESFFRGLKNDDSDDSYKMVARISALDKKIEQYKMMLNVSEYQESLAINVENKLFFETYEQQLDKEVLLKKQQLGRLENEIASISNVMRKNKNFADYITQKGIFVKNPADESSPIRVTNETLYGFNDNEEIIKARLSRLTAERNRLKREILEKEKEQEKEITFLNLPTIDEELTKKFAVAQSIGSIQVKTMLEKFQKEKRNLQEALREKTRQSNIWITHAYEIINNYATELKLPLDYKIDIFTSNLKEKSGAVLHEMVYIFKLAYIKLLSKKLGYRLPIFCDSPSGREVRKETIDAMMQILKRDFSNHQIIIASIYKYDEIFDTTNIIEMNKLLFDKQTIFDDF